MRYSFEEEEAFPQHYNYQEALREPSPAPPLRPMMVPLLIAAITFTFFLGVLLVAFVPRELWDLLLSRGLLPLPLPNPPWPGIP